MLAKQRAIITKVGKWMLDHKFSLLPETRLGVKSRVWIFLEAAAGLHCSTPFDLSAAVAFPDAGKFPFPPD